MRNFRTVVTFIILMILTESLFSFMLEPATYKHQLNAELRIEKENGITPDMVVIGDSTIRSGLDTRILKRQIPGIHCVLNAGTSSQSLCGTYYYLKDILKKYHIKTAVVGVSYWQLMGTGNTALKKEFIVLDRITDPLIRVQYIHDTMSVEELPLLLKSRQYCDKFSSVRENLKIKLSRDYLFNNKHNINDITLGYIPMEKEIGKGHVGIEKGEWDELKTEADSESMCYLEKIVKLCRKNHVDVHLISMPLETGIICSDRSLDSLHDQMQKFALDNGIFFDDMNLLKARSEICPDERMNSADHLSRNSAEKFTEVYAKILVNEQNRTSNVRYMYDSLEMARNAMNAVLAVDFHTEPADNGTRKIIARSIVKAGCIPEYQFYFVSGNDKKVHILKEYSSINECKLPAKYVGVKGSLMVECRVKGIRSEKSMSYIMETDRNTWK